MDPWKKRNSDYAVSFTVDVKPTEPGDTEEGAEAIAKAHMKEIKSALSSKKYISTEEFAEIFNIGEDTQKNLRNRLKHALPYIQIKTRGNIQYNTKKIEKWLENYQINY